MRNWIVLTILPVFLTACSSQTISSVESTVEEITTPISQTDFTKSEAENVFNMAVRNHCKLTGQVCTVEKVVLQDDNIYGIYTYTQDDEEYMVSGTLENVAVSNVNSSIVTIGRKMFSTGVKQTESSDDTTEQVTVEETGLPHFDLASEISETTESSTDWIYEQDDYKILLLNIGSGSMNFNGTYEGSGTYEIYALTLDQSVSTLIVSMQGTGSFDETAQLESGWYYIVVKKTDGTATLNWASE